jgi:hypothetical protein
MDKLWDPLSAVMHASGLLYVESGDKVIPPPDFELIREGRAGHVHFALLRFAAMQKTDNNPAVS